MAKKQSLGRQKITISKIQIKKSHLQVTFSKRRSGLFKKVSELFVLCGIDIAIVVFSPAGKVFWFGHHKVKSVIDRFLVRNPNVNATCLHVVESHRFGSNNIPELNMLLMCVLNEFEAEKKRSETLGKMRKYGRRQFWLEAPIEDMNLDELQQVKDSRDDLKKRLVIQASNFFTEISNSISIFSIDNSNDNGNTSRDGVGHYKMKPSSIISASFGASHAHSYDYHVHCLL